MLRHRKRIYHVLAAMDEHAAAFGADDFHIGHAVFASGLNFYEIRQPLRSAGLDPTDASFDWRTTHPGLAAWYDRVRRRPSLRLPPAHPHYAIARHEEFVLTVPLWSREALLDNPRLVPNGPGVYVWFFPPIVPGLADAARTKREGRTLMYLGVAGRAAAPADEGRGEGTLWHQTQVDLHGDAGKSALRLALGCLMADQLGITLRRAGSGQRLTFTRDGERRLSEWIARHGRVGWMSHPDPQTIAPDIRRRLSLPLNLDGNSGDNVNAPIRSIVANAQANARAMPVVRE